MKKIITILAAISMLALSCQKEDTPVNEDSRNPAEGKLTATIVKTKVTYTETAELNLQPAWEVGDKIIGFDDAGKTYTLTVASVSAETATLSGNVPDGALHLIYKSGAKASDISSKTLAIDYTAQAGDKTMPAVMLADGTVENGSCNFAFTNAGAIIGISAVKGVPSGAAISKFTVEGENLSAATVELDGSVLKLTASTKASDAISTTTLSGLSVTNGNGKLSKTVFIAVPAGAKIKKVSAGMQARVPETMTIPSTAADKKNIDYVEIAAKYDGTHVTTKKWAKWNVGANSQSEYGWYFAWGGTEGYLPTEISKYGNCKWVSASGVDSYSYTLSSAKITNASDYLYIKTQSFAAAGHSFDWAHAPFNNGSSNYDDTYFSSVRNTVCPDNILAKEYDAARANWGGTWRMPTSAEFNAMKNATYWDREDSGYYVYAPNPASDAGKINSSGTGSYSKESALLFIPSAGYGYESMFNDADYSGRYWSGSLNSSIIQRANAVDFYYNKVRTQNIDYGRCCGQPVRPLSD